MLSSLNAGFIDCLKKGHIEWEGCVCMISFFYYRIAKWKGERVFLESVDATHDTLRSMENLQMASPSAKMAVETYFKVALDYSRRGGGGTCVV